MLWVPGNSPGGSDVDQHKLHPADVAVGDGDAHDVGHSSGVVMVIEHLQSKQDAYKHIYETR